MRHGRAFAASPCRPSQQASAAEGRTRSARSRVGTAKGLAHHLGRQQHRHRLLLCCDGGAVLPARRHSGAADAAPAGGAKQHVPQSGNLQPDLHDAWHRDDVPVRGAGCRGDGRPAAAADARRTRPPFPAAQCLRVLGLFRRRPHLLRHAVLRSSALGWLVHVSAAHRPTILAGPRRGLLAARHRLHRDIGDRGCDRTHRRRAAHARARHDARPDADVRLDDADFCRDDRVRVSGCDPSDHAARTGARVRMAVLHTDEGRRCTSVAAPVLVLRSPRGLHHLPAGGRHRLDDRADDGGHTAGRIPAHRRRADRDRLLLLRPVGASHVHDGHPGACRSPSFRLPAWR